MLPHPDNRQFHHAVGIGDGPTHRPDFGDLFEGPRSQRERHSRIEQDDPRVRSATGRPASLVTRNAVGVVEVQAPRKAKQTPSRIVKTFPMRALR
ncbi:MAG: hypothetical protein ACFHWZ_02520 [Phycisphaerales bacterium]